MLAFHPQRQEHKEVTLMGNPTLTVADIASKFNVSRATVYRRIKDGTLTPYRLGPRVIRFDAAEVAEAFRA